MRPNLARKIRARLSATFGYAVYERRFGLDTRGDALLPEHDGESLPYGAIPWRLLRQFLRNDELTPDDVFLDAGCGKGRAVFQAARLYPFKRVMGFDFSPGLVAVAQANIDHSRRHLRCRNVELFVADAKNWPVPDDVTLVFLCNPFVGDVLKRFTQQVVQSFDRRPRKLRLLYVGGWDHATVEQAGRFHLLRGQESAGGPDCRLYEVEPPELHDEAHL